MRRIIHLSDLHFGKTDPRLERPLLRKIDELAPDLVIVSGDFTQRARRHQFAQARAFLNRIKAPVLAVPGNHDTPLDNVLVRFVTPWRRYRQAIDRELEPEWRDARVHVVGVNTVNRFKWQRGRIGPHTIRRVCSSFSAVPRDVLRIVVMHHPLEHGPETDKKLMEGASHALRRLSKCGADIVLSGHLHEGSAAPFHAAPGLLFVQAGTGLSTRLRGTPNMFNLLEHQTAGEVSITRYLSSSEGKFAPEAVRHFRKTAQDWSEVASPSPIEATSHDMIRSVAFAP
ncbi:metallophosphoesterase family protein [Thioclava sp. GXIMD2076]|uniref:metallophosphoesterase family protein n=1 Tax=Thioclava sp. GXIMD2076 TaxID=3131931 RepID=UPI0030D1386C